MDQVPLLELFNTATDNIALAALLLSSGLIMMVASREAFDHDPAEQVSLPMGGPVVTVRRWKYLSEHAERARRNLYLLAQILRVGIGTCLSILLVYMLVASAASFFQRWGAGTGLWAEVMRNLHVAWATLDIKQAIVQYLFAATVMLFGPLMVLQLCNLVYRVVMLRRAYGGTVETP